jgi:hypothetical protein
MLWQVSVQQKSASITTKINNYSKKKHVFVATKNWLRNNKFATYTTSTKITIYSNKKIRWLQQKVETCVNRLDKDYNISDVLSLQNLYVVTKLLNIYDIVGAAWWS